MNRFAILVLCVFVLNANAYEIDHRPIDLYDEDYPMDYEGQQMYGQSNDDLYNLDNELANTNDIDQRTHPFDLDFSPLLNDPNEDSPPSQRGHNSFDRTLNRNRILPGSLRNGLVQQHKPYDVPSNSFPQWGYRSSNRKLIGENDGHDDPASHYPHYPIDSDDDKSIGLQKPSNSLSQWGYRSSNRKLIGENDGHDDPASHYPQYPIDSNDDKSNGYKKPSSTFPQWINRSLNRKLIGENDGHDDPASHYPIDSDDDKSTGHKKGKFTRLRNYKNDKNNKKKNGRKY